VVISDHMVCIEMVRLSGTGKEYEYVVIDDYSGTVYTKPLHTRSEAAGALKVYGEHGSNEAVRSHD
jgi:hypothetical protein